MEVRGIIGSHVRGFGGDAAGTATAACRKVGELLEAMGPEGRYRVCEGSNRGMDAPDVPAPSEGARLIVEEAMRNDTDTPLYIVCGASLTTVASAWLMEPEKAYPDYQAKDLLDVDFIFRPGAVEQARLKASQPGSAPVYTYLFTWKSPVLDGMFRSTHCMEIPFVFNNVLRHASMTGGGTEARALGETMSSAWLNFARTGNPNGEGVPQWDAYTPENGATMFFGNRCEVRRHHDRELMEVVRSFPVRGF